MLYNDVNLSTSYQHRSLNVRVRDDHPICTRKKCGALDIPYLTGLKFINAGTRYWFLVLVIEI